MKSQCTETEFQHEVFNSSLNSSSDSHQDQILTYHAALQTDYDTGHFNVSDPRAYAARHKLNYLELPFLYEALHGDASHHYIEAMKLEISQLIKQKT